MAAHVKVAFVPRMAMVLVGGVVMVGAAEGGRKKVERERWKGGRRGEGRVLLPEQVIHCSTCTCMCILYGTMKTVGKYHTVHIHVQCTCVYACMYTHTCTHAHTYWTHNTDTQ